MNHPALIAATQLSPGGVSTEATNLIYSSVPGDLFHHVRIRLHPWDAISIAKPTKPSPEAKLK